MNKVVIGGRLCGDPELRTLPTGSVTSSFTLAVERRKKDAGTDFIICEAWGKVAELLNQYCHKGEKLYVSGRLNVDEYTAKDGTRRHSTRVIVEEFDFPVRARGEQTEQPTAQPTQMTEVEDSDLPF